MTQTDWTSLGKPTATIKLSPTVAQNTDGRLEVFTVGTDGTLWHIWQTIPDKLWSNWDPLTKPPHTNVLVVPGVGKNADGRLEVFTIGSDGALWHIWQTAPGHGPWFNWFSSGQPAASIANAQFPPSVAQNTDGRLEVFTVGSDGALWHIYQEAPNGTWSSWTPLGKPPNLTAVNVPVVGKNADGRLEVFTIGSDGALWHTWQTAPGHGPWFNWFSSGQPAASIANAQFPPSVAQNTDGRLEVFTIGSDGALWHIWQTTPNGTWSNWASLGLPQAASITSPPTVEKNKDGHLEVLVSGHDGALWHIWQTVPGNGWGNWASLGTPPNIVINSSPYVSENADGRLEAFANGSDGALWHCWQVSPGGLWGGPPVTASATVIITPVSHLLSDNFIITAVTGTPHPADRQVQARILSATSVTGQSTVTSSGSLPGTRATGLLTFENTALSSITFPGTVLTGKSGVPVSFTGPIAVPATGPAALTVTGFAVNVGTGGNIGALDIDGPCCAPGIIVKNGAFSGGQNPMAHAIVEQADIDAATNQVVATLKPGVLKDLQGQVRSNEAVVPGTLQCPSTSNLTPDHNAGDHAGSVTVSGTITCTEEVYDQQAALTMVANLLEAEALKDFGPNYALTGNIVTGVTQITQGSGGIVNVEVSAEGVWVYNQFDIAKLKQDIAGMSKQDATDYLLTQPGVSSAQLELSSGNTLPVDPAHIIIVIEPVPSAPPQR